MLKWVWKIMPAIIAVHWIADGLSNAEMTYLVSSAAALFIVREMQRICDGK